VKKGIIKRKIAHLLSFSDVLNASVNEAGKAIVIANTVEILAIATV
jgi:hypothetical protein